MDLKLSLPGDIKKLNIDELVALADNIRKEIIETTKRNGGHLASNLGIVETTIALYYVFDFPKDKLIFDVGHQCYAHKILSGRDKEFSTIRTDNGLSGFPDIAESQYDSFTTGHAGTSISAGLGYCTARDSLKEDYSVINVVGDGAFTNGLNLEALAVSNTKPKNYLVILNDNGMSISKNKNGLYEFISRETTKKSYVNSKRAIQKIFGNSFITKGLMAIRNFLKRMLNKGNYFEQYGFKYVGVLDGNNLKELIKIMTRVKEVMKDKPVFLHIKTTKGKGYNDAEQNADMYHGVGVNLLLERGSSSETVGNELNNLIEKDNKVVAITAAMKNGTGLDIVEKAHPENFYDVGIAESYAVTFAAGLAKGGLKPFVCIYSTFLQRAYDQIIHDVCLMNLPVVFCIDRAGLVGKDGKTHQGVYDLSYLSHIPNMHILTPVTASDIKSALNYAVKLNCPVAIRYPKNSGVCNIEKDIEDAPFLKLKDGDKITILAVGGNMLESALRVADEVDGVAVYSVRMVKPLDTKTLDKIKNTTVITMEENSEIGGFGSLVNNYYKGATRVIILGVKDKFISHGSVKNQLAENGLDYESLKKLVLKI